MEQNHKLDTLHHTRIVRVGTRVIVLLRGPNHIAGARVSFELEHYYDEVRESDEWNYDVQCLLFLSISPLH